MEVFKNKILEITTTEVMSYGGHWKCRGTFDVIDADFISLDVRGKIYIINRRHIINFFEVK